ncbi:MAG: flagellar biosynthetic protein FliO [Burkholderiales bacterium]|nr:flagellar biosynthetic protein FliO [Burkholderiales bacterium]
MQDAPSVLPALLAFVAVAALIPVALWVLKRLQGGTQGAARPVTLAGGLTLGPRERVVVVEADGRRWMLGVTGQSITMLAELDRAAPTQDGSNASAPGQTPAAFPPNPFAQILERLKRNA